MLSIKHALLRTLKSDIEDILVAINGNWRGGAQKSIAGKDETSASQWTNCLCGKNQRIVVLRNQLNSVPIQSVYPWNIFDQSGIEKLRDLGANAIAIADAP